MSPGGTIKTILLARRAAVSRGGYIGQPSISCTIPQFSRTVQANSPNAAARKGQS